MTHKSTNWSSHAAAEEKREHALNLGMLMLRVGVSVLMLFGHGADKLVNFSAKAASFADPLGVGVTVSLVLAIFAEFFCSVAVGFGLFTRLATIPLIITMLVAAFFVHGGDPWARMELPWIYLIIYLAILIAGPGKYSMDYKIARRREQF